ncbi:hypothetical protein K6U06_10920 [Acidiferrimicrobium sp. IK]|uniref:hypothetical protein n=1 Tax=Acidiferrimicrobium sp. IK TaxID=2871700 RepID=UPI0021CB01F3|nr:hypothetical protein [Acidiferrimicrobium sp. IK]MCU4184872.1 hypothetical protein [Acidiferrimicrobium sp. IK]
MPSFRRVAAPVAGASVGLGLIAAGGPADLATMLASTMGDIVAGVMPLGRSQAEVAKDEANRERRAVSYEAFGAAVASAWQAAGLLMTFRPGFLGYVPGMVALFRAQRRFEEQVVAMTEAMTCVFLYGSGETQTAGVAVVEALHKALQELCRCKQGSAEAAAAFTRLSPQLGTPVAAWRRSAQADLGVAR